MSKAMRRDAYMAVLVSAALGLAVSAGIAAETNAPLKGLNAAPILHFPTRGSVCYGLDPLAPELRVNDAIIRDLASAGFQFPLPRTDNGSTTTLGTVSGPYIKISDRLLKVNDVNCVDRLELVLIQPANVRLPHSGQTYASEVQLWAVEDIIVGAGKNDYLARRQQSLTQMFSLLAGEWKKQNGN